MKSESQSPIGWVDYAGELMRTAGFLLSSSALAEHLAADGPERESSSGQGCTYRIVGYTSELLSSAILSY